ncbi:MAG: cytochrome c [Lautropia sp.]
MSQPSSIARRFAGPALAAGLFGLAALAAALPAAAADLAAGEKIALERCASCHGKDGNTPIDPSYPRLSGQHEDYLVEALKAYQTDRRKNPIMGAQAKQLSRADVLNLSAYYARLPGMMNHQR